MRFILLISVIFVAQLNLLAQNKSKEHYQKVLSDLLTDEQQIFRTNGGQFSEEVLYHTSGSNAAASFTRNEVRFSLIKDVQLVENSADPFQTRASFLNWGIEFIGSNVQDIIPTQEVKRNIHYFGAQNAGKSAVKEYRQISYREVYPNTDLIFYSAEHGALKYDFVLKPGGDISNIRLNYKGVKGLTVSDSGGLSVETDWGRFLEEKPYCYQWINGDKKEVEVAYLVRENSNLEFVIKSNYNPEFDLIIDPIYVDWSTYFYGTAVTGSYGWNYVLDIDIDDEDYVYITGMTYNQSFSSQLGGYDTTYNTGYDAFLCKITPKGDSLRYFTFIGGSNWEYSMNVAVGTSKEAVISGITWGAGYPTTSGAYDENGRTCGGSYCYQGFVTKFSKNGDSLVYSTYLGGRTYTSFSIDWIRGMQVTDNGNVYLVGNTQAEDFPTTSGCYQSTYGGHSTATGSWWWNSGDGFLTCLNSSGSALVFSTYIGGAGNDVAHDLYVAPGGEIYVVGKTSSTNFSTTPGASVFNTYIKGSSDGFIVKLKKNGQKADFSKLMGGTGDESFEGIYANENGEPYIVGHTNSNDFPVSSNAMQKSNGGGYDLVVVKLISAGTNFRYSTYLGGSGDDGYSLYTYWFDNMSITANVKEEAIISATTKSNNFPITSDALQSTNNSLSWYGKLTISKINYQGTKLMYGTYFGGSGGEFPGGIRAKRVGCVTFVLFAGNSYSGDYPTTSGVYKPSRSTTGTFWTGFVTKFRDTLYTEKISLALKDTIVECDNVFEILDAGNQGADFLWSDGWKDRYKIAKDSGTLWVQATYGCDTVRDTVTIELEHSPKIPVLGNDTTYCNIFPTLTLDAKNDTIYRSYLWHSGSTNQTIQVNKEGKYWVDIKTPNCGTKTDTINLKLLKTPVVDLGADRIECDSVALTLNAGNLNNEVKYRWNTKDSTATILVRDTGYFGVRVSNFCGSDTSDIHVGKYTFPMAVLPSDSIFCDQVSWPLKGGDGKNGEIYSWKSLDGSVTYATTPTYSMTTAHDVVLEVRNSCGRALDSLSVSMLITPNDRFRDTILACDIVSQKLSTGLSGNAETYRWNTGHTGYEITASSPGFYEVITKNKCGADSSRWNILLAFTPQVSLPNDTIFCGVVNYKLDVKNQDPAMKYLWQDGSQLPDLTASQPGKYAVRISNRCGQAKDSLLIGLLQTPMLNLGEDRVFCGGISPFILQIGDPANQETYLWSDGSGDRTMNVSDAGQHWAEISNKCGKVSDTLLVRISPYPVVDLGFDTVLCGNFKLELDAGNPGMSYQWFPFGENTRTIEATEQRLYEVHVTNSDGCTGKGRLEIGSGCISKHFVPSSFSPNGDELNEVFKPTLINFEDYRLSVFNRWGELMFETQQIENGWDGSYQGSQVPAGVYLYNLRFIATEDGSYRNISGLLHIIR